MDLKNLCATCAFVDREVVLINNSVSSELKCLYNKSVFPNAKLCSEYLVTAFLSETNFEDYD